MKRWHFVLRVRCVRQPSIAKNNTLAMTLVLEHERTEILEHARTEINLANTDSNEFSFAMHFSHV